MAAYAQRRDLLLLDTALEQLSDTLDCELRDEDAEQDMRLDSVALIIEQLRADLDLNAGSIFVNLDDLYNYMGRQLTCANPRNRVAKMDEVSHLLREIRSAWATLPPPAYAVRTDASRETHGAAS